jgi:hypothetical protein
MAELPTALTGGVEIPADAANPSGIEQPLGNPCWPNKLGREILVRGSGNIKTTAHLITKR